MEGLPPAQAGTQGRRSFGLTTSAIACWITMILAQTTRRVSTRRRPLPRRWRRGEVLARHALSADGTFAGTFAGLLADLMDRKILLGSLSRG